MYLVWMMYKQMSFNLVIGYLPLSDLNRLRLVCMRLKKAVELQNTLRWKKNNLTWQLPTAPLKELRQHLVMKLAESYVKSLSRGKVENVMKMWAGRLEEKAFLEASSQAEYSMTLTQLIFARHEKLVRVTEKEFLTCRKDFLLSSFPCVSGLALW